MWVRRTKWERRTCAPHNQRLTRAVPARIQQPHISPIPFRLTPPRRLTLKAAIVPFLKLSSVEQWQCTGNKW
ncbi:hypothetical protein BJ165DRAFT_1493004 [Panaeolus papilionaceus]|nr:hypothetical protein BJ165DRAFT_1493004 [Panaeolus papilionaceus]